MDGYISYADARRSQIAALEAAVPRLAAEVAAQRRAGRLAGPGPVFLAIGASLAAAGAATWVLRSRGIDAWRLGAGDTPTPLPRDGRIVIAVSQSGRSAETLAAIETVPQGLRYAVVNAAESPIAAASTEGLPLGDVPDSYASTIGYTLTVLGLGLIAEAWDGELDEDAWRGFGDRLRAVEEQVDIASAVALFEGAPWADFVGGGPSAGTAEAGALLFREVARIPSAALSTRQYLHGAMESAGGGVHVLFGDDREHDLAATLARAGERVLVVSTRPVSQDGVVTLVVPECSPVERAIHESLLLQRIVAEVTEGKGLQIEEFVFHNSDIKVAE